MFRVWDNINNKWIKDDIIEFRNEDVAIIKKNKLGKNYSIKLLNTDNNKYIFHHDIGCYDKDGILIYEGDILSYNNLIGHVVYSNELASYILLEYTESKYYNLGLKQCSECKIIGNIFENLEFINNDKQ